MYAEYCEMMFKYVLFDQMEHGTLGLNISLCKKNNNINNNVASVKR